MSAAATFAARAANATANAIAVFGKKERIIV